MKYHYLTKCQQKNLYLNCLPKPKHSSILLLPEYRDGPPVQSLVYRLWTRAPAVGPWVAVRVLKTNICQHFNTRYPAQVLVTNCTLATHLRCPIVCTHLGGCPKHPDMLGRAGHHRHWGGGDPHLAHHAVRGRGVRHGVPGVMGDQDPGAGHRPRHGQRGQELPLKYLYLILWQIQLGEASIILKKIPTYLSSFFWSIYFSSQLESAPAGSHPACCSRGCSHCSISQSLSSASQYTQSRHWLHSWFWSI